MKFRLSETQEGNIFVIKASDKDVTNRIVNVLLGRDVDHYIVLIFKIPILHRLTARHVSIRHPSQLIQLALQFARNNQLKTVSFAVVLKSDLNYKNTMAAHATAGWWSGEARGSKCKRVPHKKESNLISQKGDDLSRY